MSDRADRRNRRRTWSGRQTGLWRKRYWLRYRQQTGSLLGRRKFLDRESIIGKQVAAGVEHHRERRDPGGEGRFSAVRSKAEDGVLLSRADKNVIRTGLGTLTA